MMNTQNLDSSKKQRIVWMLLCFVPLVGMGIDLIAPSLPAISQKLQISAVLAKNLIAIYLLGLMLGTFLSGTLSDAWGRRNLMRSGFILLTLISLLPVLWPKPDILLLSRLIQGLAIGCIGAMIRSSVTDLLSGPSLLRAASWIATMWGIGPILGPIIGGYLQVYFGWQAGFFFFAIYGAIGSFISLFHIPETHHQRQSLSLTRLKNNFARVLPHQVFLSLGLLMGCFYAALIVFNTLAPFYVEKWLGYSPIFFGHAAFFMGLIFLSGTFCCRGLVKKIDPHLVLKIGIPITIVLSLVGILLAYTTHSIWALFISSGFLFFANGIIYPTCMGASMSLFRDLAGGAAAIITLINLFVTTLVGSLVSLLSVHSAKPIAWSSAAVLILGSAFYFWAQWQSRE